MAASFGGFDLNSLAALSESDNYLNDRMVDDGLGNKKLIEKLDDGFRILDKAKVLVGEKDRIGESLNNGKEFVNMDDKNDGSKSRVVEMIACDDDFVLDMVGRVLDGKFGSVDKEVGDGRVSQSGLEINLVMDMNSWKETVGDATSEKGICVRSAIDEDADLVNLGCSHGVTVLRGEQDLTANELVPGGDSETKEETDVLMMEGYGKHGSVNDELLPGGKTEIEEAGNVEADVLMSERYGERFTSEKYDEYHVSDLVWGKVRSHPWWPGQIFAPSAASDKALEYMKNDSYLIAYFGDGTFAWNEESKIKPFLMNFSEMENQSNTEEICHAVSCAMDEVSRRVEVGLSCACLPREVRNKIETQVVVNAGIRKRSSKRVGGGRFFTAENTFFPYEIVDFVNFVATHPSRKVGKLSVAEKKAELTAFSRWSGHHQLPSFEEFGELVDDEKGERSDYEVDKVQSKNRKSHARPSFDENLTYKKKRCISSLMPSTMSGEIAQRYGARISQKGENILSNRLDVHEILTKLRLVAINPMQFGSIMGPAADFILEYRSSVYGKKSFLLKSRGGNKMKQSSSNLGTADEFVIQSSSKPEEHKNETSDYKPTAFILQFDKLESIPPVANLNEIFRRFGPLMELETKISSKSMRAQVIFEKRADADVAYSSPGKYSTFGPSLVKYALNHTPTLRKAGRNSKHNKKSHA